MFAPILPSPTIPSCIASLPLSLYCRNGCIAVPQPPAPPSLANPQREWRGKFSHLPLKDIDKLAVTALEFFTASWQMIFFARYAMSRSQKLDQQLEHEQAAALAVEIVGQSLQTRPACG